MREKKKDDQNKDIPNISVHYYTDPVYGSSDLIYGIDEYAAGEPEVRDEVKEEAADEPVESWGWINNIEPK